MQLIKDPVSVFWFRRDLRIVDNHGFFEALKNGTPVLPVFIYDTLILDNLTDKEDRRLGFIHQFLNHLNEEFKKKGSSLYILHCTPMEAFIHICNAFQVMEVITNHDYEPYAVERDANIKDFLYQKNIPFHTYKDQVIFDRSDIVKSDATPYTMYAPYSKVWKKQYAELGSVTYPSEQFLGNTVKTDPFPFPSLKDIGFEEIEKLMPYTLNEQTLLNYHKTRDHPGTAGTSQVSVHLRFGTVSTRHLIKLAVSLNEKWLNELIWREFFMMILYHFPGVVKYSFKKKFDDIQWRNNKQEFELWCRGETGYPLVDAGMRQLNETGWMHNRVRIVVASFLVKHLLIDWRWGDAYFAQKLLDYELASNNGNWQWIAGSGCDAAPYFRVFNPAAQTLKFDPDLVYIKRWVKGFHPGYLPPIVEHEFARKRALEVYKKGLAIL